MTALLILLGAAVAMAFQDPSPSFGPGPTGAAAPSRTAGATSAAQTPAERPTTSIAAQPEVTAGPPPAASAQGDAVTPTTATTEPPCH